MEKKEKHFSKRFLSESLFKKYSKKTWDDAQEVSKEKFTVLKYTRFYLI